jgi:alkylation response protein AidB-like acyl-CoA dehydrogenase
MDFETLHTNLTTISARFADDRQQRQTRRQLDQADFDALRDAGFPLVGLPAEDGGLWKGVRQSTRPICAALRTLARGDSSVALVCSMHPAVLSYWLTIPDGQRTRPVDAQRSEISTSVRDGEWWGTITSEPGSGGDVVKTRAVAQRGERPLEYFLSGQKHFGSGSGITSFMVTTAVPEGEDRPDWFFVDMRDVPWDGSRGVTRTAEWDGHGMIATQSHSMSFERFPATRIAWTGHLADVVARAGGFIGCLFTSVIVGIVDAAVENARDRFDKDTLRPYEQVEWARANMEAWLIEQSYEGMLGAIERKDEPRLDVLQGKTAIAELAEALLGRLCKVAGGSSFARRSPFGFWFEDVRALGFLRPPWGLAYQTMIDGFV